MGSLMKWVLFSALAVLLALCSVIWAQAATFSGNQTACDGMAYNAEQTAQMRDAGIPWDVFSNWLRPQLEEAIPDPGSFVKSQADVVYIMALFKRIYDQPEIAADAFKHIVYQDCMKTAASKRKSGV